MSPKQIAKTLNREGVPAPSAAQLESEHDLRQCQRGTGILNNELYIGRLVWNRLRYVKNPDTGKRVSRLNPSSEWIARSAGAADRVGRAVDGREGAAGATRHAMHRPASHRLHAKRPQLPVLGPDEVRRLRWWIHHVSATA